MQLKWLMDFLSLCKNRNFTIAAEQRHVSPSAFSRRINALESWIGEELFDRSRHPVELTAAGQYLSEKAQNILDLAQEVRSEVGKRSQLKKWEIMFHLSADVSQYLLSDWIRELSSDLANWDVVINISDGLNNKYADCFLKSKYDFYIASSYEDCSVIGVAPFVESITLAEDVLVPVCNRALLHGRDRCTLREAVDVMPYICDTPTSDFDRLTSKRLIDQGISVMHRHKIEIADASCRRVMVHEGVGFSWAHLSSVETDIKSGRLVVIGEVKDQIQVKVKLYFLSDSDSLVKNELLDKIRRRKTMYFKEHSGYKEAVGH